MESFFQKVREAWNRYPAVVVAKEISSPEELPLWEQCGKNEIYVGVIREKRKPDVLVVRYHKMGAVLRCKVRVENLKDEELRKVGILPLTRQTCTECGEFSTWIYRNGHGLCPECMEKARAELEQVQTNLE